MKNKGIFRNGTKDQASFESLFYANYESLVFFAQTYLNDRASCEDIVQEVFIYIWENSDTLKINVCIKGYLYKMVKNRMLNHLNTLRITFNIEVLDYDLIKTPDDDLLQLQEDKKSKIIQVLSLVDKLPSKMKEIFVLKYRRNYSYAEISLILNISPNTIKTQLKRAKNILQSKVSLIILLIFLRIFKIF